MAGVVDNLIWVVIAGPLPLEFFFGVNHGLVEMLRTVGRGNSLCLFRDSRPKPFPHQALSLVALALTLGTSSYRVSAPDQQFVGGAKLGVQGAASKDVACLFAVQH